MNGIKAIILDFDGVIVESVDIKTQAFRKLFAGYADDVEPIVNYHLRNNGVSRFIKFKYIWEEMLHRSYNDVMQKELSREFSRIVLDKVVGCPFVKGALNFLKEFHKKVPLYVASAVPENELATIIERKGLRGYFTKMFGCPPVTKIQAIMNAISDLRIEPEEILFIGDSVEDLKASKSAGTQFVGRRNKEDFKDCSVPVFDDMNGITEYILSNIKIENERIRYSK